MRTWRHKRFAVAMLSAVLPATLMLSACGSSDSKADSSVGSDATTLDALYDAAVKDGQATINVYGPAETAMKPVYDEFMARFPKIKVNGEFLFGGELEARLQQEQATGKSSGDLLHVDDAVRYENILTKIKLVGVDNVADDLKLYDGKLYATSRGTAVFAYNTDKLKEADVPKTWADIVSPSFTAKIGMSDPTSLAVTSTVLYGAYKGGAINDEWVKALAADKPRIYDSTSQMIASLGTGEIAFTPVAYYGFLPTLLKQGAHVGYVVPSDGISVTDNPYGLLKSAPHPAAANLLVSWLLTKDGQASLVKNVKDYGVMPGAPTPEGLPPVTDLKPFPQPEPSERIANKEEAVEYFKKFF